MAIGAIVTKLNQSTVDQAQIRVDMDVMYFNDTVTPPFAELHNLSAYFAVGATITQMAAAIGSAVRAYGSGLGLTIPANAVFAPSYAKV